MIVPILERDILTLRPLNDDFARQLRVLFDAVRATHAPQRPASAQVEQMLKLLWEEHARRDFDKQRFRRAVDIAMEFQNTLRE